MNRAKAYMWFNRWMHSSGSICQPAPVTVGCITNTVTLVRLGKGILPLQKLLHFMFIFGKTQCCITNKKSESPVWFKRHCFPSKWGFGLPIMIAHAGGSHRRSKLIPLNGVLPCNWFPVWHGSSPLVRLTVNQNSRFLLGVRYDRL